MALDALLAEIDIMEDLYHRSVLASEFNYYSGVATMSMLTIIVATVTFILLKRKLFCKLPTPVMLSLIGYIVLVLMQDTWNVITLVRGNWKNLIFTTAGRVMLLLNIVTFLSIHWLFTSHYLQVAVLFRVTSLRNSSPDLGIMWKRKKYLKAIDLAMYAIFASVTVYFVVSQDGKGWLTHWLIFWATSLSIIALVSIPSMIHILRKSKPLRSLGIHPNNKQMYFYASFWLGATICILVCMA